MQDKRTNNDRRSDARRQDEQQTNNDKRSGDDRRKGKDRSIVHRRFPQRLPDVSGIPHLRWRRECSRFQGTA